MTIIHHTTTTTFVMNRTDLRKTWPKSSKANAITQLQNLENPMQIGSMTTANISGPSTTPSASLPRIKSAKTSLKALGLRTLHPSSTEDRQVSKRTATSKNEVEWLAISGGGMAGIAAWGALAVLQRRGVLEHLKGAVGTSIGSILAAMVLDSRIDLRERFKSVGRSFVFDRDVRFTSHGIYGGKSIACLIRALLDVDDTTTLMQYENRVGKQLEVCVLDVNTREPLYLSAATHPNMQLITALVASCSIPFLFPAVSYEGMVLCDGGVVDNFPMKRALYLSGGKAGLGSVLGVSITPTLPNNATPLSAFISKVISASILAQEGGACADQRYTINIPVDSCIALKFDMEKGKRKELYLHGVACAVLYLKKNV